MHEETLAKPTQKLFGKLTGYPLLKSPLQFQGTLIASIDDIACMKLDALASRGTKRDFIDLYCISKQLPLKTLLVLFQQKYASVHYNLLHIKKSLVYFDDADSEPLPDMRVPIKWNEAKEFFKREALNL